MDSVWCFTFFGLVSLKYFISKAIELESRKEKRLIKWESLLTKELLHAEETESKESTENKIQLALEKYFIDKIFIIYFKKFYFL